jgi:hypothetical protein
MPILVSILLCYGYVILNSDSLHGIYPFTLQSSTKVSPSTIIPSIQILALEVHVEVRNELKTVSSFLKCFPNVETLHVKVSPSNFLLLSEILHRRSASLHA